jgi:hypothetical protein
MGNTDNLELATSLESSVKNFMIRIIYSIQKFLHIRPKEIHLITGCPRSGTSAVRDWLQQHKELSTVFESRVLVGAHQFTRQVNRFATLSHHKESLLENLRNIVFDHYASIKFVFGKILIEKEPLEPIAFPDLEFEEFLENTRLLFPDLKIVFMLRDPLATVWSMRCRKWGYSLTSQELREFSLEECIETWNQSTKIVRAFSHDSNFYVCSFESLVEDPLLESSKIYDFLGVTKGTAFQPKATKEIGFSEEEKTYILALLSR